MGDHAWGLMQTAPNSMRPSSVGTSKIRRDDPGLQTVAGGQYSNRRKQKKKQVEVCEYNALHDVLAHRARLTGVDNPLVCCR